MVRKPAMPALLMMMSIWNFPDFGCEKWFFAVAIRWAGPDGSPTSACTGRALIEYADSRLEASCEVASAEESEVKFSTTEAPREARILAIAAPMPVEGGMSKLLGGQIIRRDCMEGGEEGKITSRSPCDYGELPF